MKLPSAQRLSTNASVERGIAVQHELFWKILVLHVYSIQFWLYHECAVGTAYSNFMGTFIQTAKRYRNMKVALAIL